MPAADAGGEPDGAAWRGVAQRVGDQVGHHLLEAPGIGEHLIGVGRHRGRQGDPGGLRVALVAAHDMLEDALDGEHPRLERRGAVLVPGQVEQVGDDALQSPGFATGGLEITGPGRLVDGDAGHRQRVEIAAHRGQRRAQLVRHVGEHLAADPVRLAQRVGAGVQLGRHPVEGAGQPGDLVGTAVVGADAGITGADPLGGVFEGPQAAAHRQEDHRADQGRGGKQHDGAGQREQPAHLAERPARRWRRQHHQATERAVDLHRGGDDRTGRAGTGRRRGRLAVERGERLRANRRTERRDAVARLAAVPEQYVDRLPGAAASPLDGRVDPIPRTSRRAPYRPRRRRRRPARWDCRARSHSAIGSAAR